MDMDLWSVRLFVHADATYPVLEIYTNISMFHKFMKFWDFKL